MEGPAAIVTSERPLGQGERREGSSYAGARERLHAGGDRLHAGRHHVRTARVPTRNSGMRWGHVARYAEDGRTCQRLIRAFAALAPTLQGDSGTAARVSGRPSAAIAALPVMAPAG